MFKEIVRLTSAIIAYLVSMWVGVSPVIQALIALMLFDVIVGVLRADQEQKLSRYELFIGIRKKLVELGMVAVMGFVGLRWGVPQMADAVAGVYSMYEGMSILDNLSVLGVPFPDWLTALFKRFSGHEPDGVTSQEGRVS
jgi:toxin secretion/phage lysis holin